MKRNEVRAKCVEILNYLMPETIQNKSLVGFDELDFVIVLIKIEYVFKCRIQEGEVSYNQFKDVDSLAIWLADEILKETI